MEKSAQQSGVERRHTFVQYYKLCTLYIDASFTTSNLAEGTLKNKLLSTITLLCVFSTLLSAGIRVDVYEYDGQTPFDYRPIMAGTNLTLVVSSDSNAYWNGGLFVDGDNRALGTLSGRGYDANTRNYAGSCFEEASCFARVTGWKDSFIQGFDMCTFYPPHDDPNSEDPTAGDWFIIDYKAEKAGDCNVGFYDYSVSWKVPVSYLSFTQVRSRDFNNDQQVDFADYAILASNWSRSDCTEPNWCGGTDLNEDGDIDCIDLVEFVEYWLWSESSAIGGGGGGGGELSMPEDSNIVISIVDVDGSNEITLDVNESITLYLRLATAEQGGFGIFDIEAMISDTNIGSIDNREYNADKPDDPNNGTARILAEPRDPFFDYVGPGYEQPEGISMIAVSIESDMNDGDLASFVFTKSGKGDIVLSPISYLTDIYTKLEGILIHGVEPDSPPEATDSNSPAEEGGGASEGDVADTNELATWLGEVWVQEPNLQQILTEEEWNQFIETVEDSEE